MCILKGKEKISSGRWSPRVNCLARCRCSSGRWILSLVRRGGLLLLFIHKIEWCVFMYIRIYLLNYNIIYFIRRWYSSRAKGYVIIFHHSRVAAQKCSSISAAFHRSDNSSTYFFAPCRIQIFDSDDPTLTSFNRDWVVERVLCITVIIYNIEIYTIHTIPDSVCVSAPPPQSLLL